MADAATPVGRIEIVGLTKRFGEVTAVDNISIDITGGEFFSMVGPSGCGKTTTLRMIAGFERPDDGEIRLDGVDMSATPPHRRSVNTVFQSYALFPHLTVAENVAFGLRYQKVTKDETRRRVAEPLGVLDARLRKDLQVELKALQQNLGITFVYVTHDQEEALTMSDRLAVMSDGRVEQMGGPQEVYEAPDTRFVAAFLGVSNMLSGNATGNGTFR